MKNERFIIKFIVKLTIWTSIIILIWIGLIHALKNMDFQWIYELSPHFYYSLRSQFYYVSYSFKTYILTFIIWLIGAGFISFFSFRQCSKYYINLISKSLNNLIDSDVKDINLPNELEILQTKMNQIKLELEKKENMIKDSEQRKNDLIVYLAHDLKTPLTSLIGYLSLLNEIKDMPKKKREKYLEVVLEKSYKLEDLINELFDITRFNSEKIILNKEEINLNLMLEQLVDDFYPILKENNKVINTNFNDKIILNGDSNKLARLFSNLIKNAIYYSTDEFINIKITQKDEKAIIIISNKYKELNQETLEKIFEKFYRIDSSRSSKTGGNGLGLAISKEIVELHNGTIKAINEKENIKFIIELPIK